MPTTPSSGWPNSALRGGQAGVAPVAVGGDDGVVERVRPVLQLKVGPVGRGAARRVDPGPGRPPGARPHERRVQRAVGVDGEARHATVEHGDGPRLELVDPARYVLVDGHLGVGEVVDQCGHRCLESVAARDDEDGQGIGRRAGRRPAPSAAPAARRPVPTPVRRRWRRAGGRVPRCRRRRRQARTAAVKAFSLGPPSAIRASGRFESTVRSPYRGLSALLQVAVTPARTSATIRSRVAVSPARRHHLGHRHRTGAWTATLAPAPPTTARTSR